jgi:AbrB family looped-hinge helix DNA binding protein
MPKATMTSKGQLTVPKAVRDALNLSKSTVVVFEVRGGEAVMRPASKGFLARFASISPSSRPEDWRKVRDRTRERVAKEVVEKLA